MTSGAAVRVGVWLTAAGLLWAACDVLENKKFPPPPPSNPPGGGTSVGSTRPSGVGGWQGGGTGGYGGFAGYYGGSAGYPGFGGYGGSRIRPDGGVMGLAGAPGISCGFSGESCISSCYVESPFYGSPICDTSRGTWICPPGLVFMSTCPAGACATTFLYCCDTGTGAREPAGCTQGGYRGQCPANYHDLTEDSCIPDGLQVSTCAQLHRQPCSADLQCHAGGYDCSCVKGDGGLVWSCPGLL